DRAAAGRYCFPRRRLPAGHGANDRIDAAGYGREMTKMSKLVRGGRLMNLESISDFLAIQRLAIFYAHCADTRRFREQAELFTPDGVWDASAVMLGRH